MFLIPIPFIILGAIPFIFVVSMIFAHVSDGRKSPRIAWATLLGLAVWTLGVFRQSFSTVLDRGGHTRRIQENSPAWEKTQVFEDVVQMPIAYIKWIIDHFRVMFGGNSAYERRIDEYLERVTWVESVNFHLWDALPGMWSKISAAAMDMFQRAPVLTASALVAALLIAYYAPAITQRKRTAVMCGMLYDGYCSDAARLRKKGASEEKIRAAEKNAQRYEKYVLQPDSVLLAITNRTRAARYVLNPWHQMKCLYLGRLSAHGGSRKRAVLSIMAGMFKLAGLLLVGYLSALFAVGYVALLLLPYLGAAGPIFGAILGMIFAVGLFGGVLRVGGMNFFFFART